MAPTCVWRAKAPASGFQGARSGAAPSPFEEGFPLPGAGRRSGDGGHAGGDGDHLSVPGVPGETRGRSFQTGPFSVSLVLCLIARLAPPDKAALSLDR